MIRKPVRCAAGFAVSLFLAAVPAHADRWEPPKRFETLSPDRTVKAAFDPALSDGGGGNLKVSKAFAGGETTLYETRLAAFPALAFVSGKGAVITVDEYYRKGYTHSVVIYSSGGRIIRDYALENLLTPDELANVQVLASSRDWLGDSPEFAFSDDDDHFQVRTGWGKNLVFDLRTGEIQ